MYRRLLGRLCLLASVGCTRAPQAPSSGAVRDALAAAVHRGAGTEITLGAVAPGSWQRIYIFGPYTDLATLRRCLGSTGGPADEDLLRGIQSRDDVNLLVFVAADGFHSIVVPRGDTDFGPEAVSRGYTPAARFVVRDPPPRSWGRLVPVHEVTNRCG